MNPNETQTPEVQSAPAVELQTAPEEQTLNTEAISELTPETAAEPPVVEQNTETLTESTQLGREEDEKVSALPTAEKLSEIAQLERRVMELQQQEAALREEIASLQATRAELMQTLAETPLAIGRLVQEGLKELEQRKQTLQIAVEQLERRQERIRNEMRTTFAGVSQDLAIRVQGFKDYLVGSLQDLVSAAEQLELIPQREHEKSSVNKESKTELKSEAPKFGEEGFSDRAKQIRRLLDQYRNNPDYYGPPWQLRRTFEPIHAERISNWFFTQGGRGALRTMGSRLQNILVASAAISVLRHLYGNRLRTLLLANSPERLGEWRRGLQDCLGITRNDFGPDRGIVLFEAPEPLVQKADRLVKEGQMPLIIIDETEEQISISLLQFPLWLAFAPELKQMAAARDF
ncbi:MAG: DUF3086 domain-containing protein [Oscillatoriaceae bacterium SKW80]|nr:DUF3086 domain-containing protein [Oscillatoriaceae bacterium SKYG93]MCX8121652.1 DUF3086 domain-containing protein [Oscillatoriaceae bacterium SKW80]MDW8453960.1 DUF3086 domain-containing protein [Oscillatoriaceae cyanobacterium SKYGB_i_bin93]HIK28795.1 DUF3086 domain-containing protein [Oscillatoriaceae cyanobacterium M7585_C2015_266]